MSKHHNEKQSSSPAASKASPAAKDSKASPQGKPAESAAAHASGKKSEHKGKK